MENRMVGLRPAWVLVIAGALSLAACGDDGGDTGTDDMGMTMDGETPDPCEGLTLCSTAGTSCTGDSLVTCAANADGCLVESTMNCASVGGTCDDSGAAAMCQTDACADIPEAERCDTEGLTCDGETLVDCAMNADGCLVATTTDCAATDGGECDDSGDTVMCVLPADPCEDIPAAERCDTEGTSCDGDSLTTCAPNAFGCLVETTEDCTGRTGGACDDSGAAAICTATDACAGITECAAAGTMCDGPELVTCAPDAFGCLVETRNDCTETMFGFCDADGTASCSTAATDPCMGMTTCDAAGRSCDGDTLEVCALNAFGCLVETPTDCTTDGNVCGEDGGVSQCGPVCSFRDTCPAMDYCDPSGDLVSCTTDADGCLVSDSTTSCGDAVCSTDACVGNCPGASPVVIDCASGTVNGDTAMGTAAIAAYSGCTTLGYPGNEQVFLFQNADAAEVSITSTRGAGSGDYDLFLLEAGDGTDACGTADTCLESSRGTSATETVAFVTAPGELYYVAFDLYSVDTETTDFTLDVTCTPVVCGDGVINGDEECDDENTDSSDGCSATCTLEDDAVCEGEPSVCRLITCGDGFVDGDEECDDDDMDASDGCSDTCTIETGYACSGEPSTCVMLPANAFCAGATAITTDTAITGEDISTGGPRPTGTGCGTSSGDSAYYYEVTVPANTIVDIETDGTFDRVLLIQESCGATECTFRTDATPESATLTNTSATPFTRIVAVHNYASSTTSGTYDISFTYSAIVCGDGLIQGDEECDDDNADPSDGCSATCTVETGYGCSGEPSSCALLPANAFCAGATPITATTTVAGEDISTGGPRPQGTGCGTSSGDNAYYYAVTVPANSEVYVTTSGSFDRVMLFQDSCAATECTYRTDSSPERGTLVNTTASPVTRIVAVHNYSSSGSGTYDITFTYAAEITASCVDMTGATALGVTGDDDASGVAALPFSFDWFGGTATHYSATSNGFAQLWSDGTGTPSTTAGNARLPGTSTPNGVVAPFWDDLAPNTGSDIYALTTGTAGSQVFVLEWRDWNTYSSSGNSDDLTFQLHLVEATGEVQFHYCAMSGPDARHTGSSATIGGESFGGTAGLSISYDTADAVMTGSGFSFVP